MRPVRSRAFAAVTAIAGLVSAMPAGAAELGFYVGFLYGDTSKEFDVEPFSAFASAVYRDLAHSSELRTYTTENDGESYGFMAGYRLTQYIAFEGGYMSIGKQSYRETSTGFFFPEGQPPVEETWSLSLTDKTTGFALSALGILPISYSWELYARAGVLIGSNTRSLWFHNDAEGTGTNEFNESSTDWLAGAGISVSLAEVYAVRAEFTRIFDAGAEVFGESDADLLSIGITVAF